MYTIFFIDKIFVSNQQSSHTHTFWLIRWYFLLRHKCRMRLNMVSTRWREPNIRLNSGLIRLHTFGSSHKWYLFISDDSWWWAAHWPNRNIGSKRSIHCSVFTVALTEWQHFISNMRKIHENRNWQNKKICNESNTRIYRLRRYQLR